MGTPATTTPACEIWGKQQASQGTLDHTLQDFHTHQARGAPLKASPSSPCQQQGWKSNRHPHHEQRHTGDAALQRGLHTTCPDQHQEAGQRPINPPAWFGGDARGRGYCPSQDPSPHGQHRKPGAPRAQSPWAGFCPTTPRSSSSAHGPAFSSSTPITLPHRQVSMGCCVGSMCRPLCQKTTTSSGSARGGGCHHLCWGEGAAPEVTSPRLQGSASDPDGPHRRAGHRLRTSRRAARGNGALSPHWYLAHGGHTTGRRPPPKRRRAALLLLVLPHRLFLLLVLLLFHLLRAAPLQRCRCLQRPLASSRCQRRLHLLPRRGGAWSEGAWSAWKGQGLEGKRSQASVHSAATLS